MNRQGSKLFWFLLALITLSIFNLLINTLRNPQSLPLVFPIYLLDSDACCLPNIEPFHQSFQLFYERLSDGFACKGKPSFLNRSGPDTVEILPDVLKNSFGMKPQDLYCTYQPILHDSRDRFELGESRILEFSKPIEDEFLRISCFRKKSAQRFWRDIIPLVPKRPQLDEKLQKRLENASGNTPNVLLIGLDSISRLNFLRNLPKTYKFIVEKLDPIILYGYHIVGENSYPNLAALFTGTPYDSFAKEKFFDEADFVWKHYAEKGFRTLYLEDMTDHGTFNSYQHRGFKKPPVHHYFRPAAYAYEHSEEGKYFCYRNKLYFTIFYNYIKTFLEAMAPPKKFFASIFLTRMFHDSVNNPQYVDSELRSMMAHLRDTGTLNTTLVLLFSDHGFRMGGFRQTTMGQLESRLPSGFLFVPPAFLERRPEAEKNLKANQHALVTAWDLHATLRQLVEPEVKTRRGVSLFERITPSRTCSEADIPAWLCACGLHKTLKPDGDVAKLAGRTVIRQINDMLEADGGPGLCHLLKLSRIIDAKAFSYLTDSVIVLVLATSPGDAVFESSLMYHRYHNPRLKVNAISRIDFYANTSACSIDKPSKRAFCFCKQNHTSLPSIVS